MNQADITSRVADYCRQHTMFSGSDAGQVLVALSGGGDSVALLHLLRALSSDFGFSITAAHLNHVLRGEESDGDEQFVRDLCSELNIPLVVERLPDGYLTGSDESLETAARESRAAFLLRIKEQTGCDRIATGHTLDDQVETVLQRIIRGTGPSGLAGILPVRDNLWIRPILCIGRKDIREFLSRENIPYREDSTNSDVVHFRNRIRHELVPLLEDRFSSGISGSIGRLTELSQVQEDYLKHAAGEAFESCQIIANTFKILIDKAKFRFYHKAVQQWVIRRALELIEGVGRDADMGEVERILALTLQDSGSADISSRVRCGTDGNTVAFIRHSTPYDPVALLMSGETAIPNGNGRIVAESSTGSENVNGVTTVILKPSIIEKYGTLSIGTVKSGESMVPFGMDRPVKIRNLISSSSAPKIFRDSLPVLRAGATPIWIPGLRASESLRIETPTRGGSASGKNVSLTYSDGIIYRK